MEEVVSKVLTSLKNLSSYQSKYNLSIIFRDSFSQHNNLLFCKYLSIVLSGRIQDTLRVKDKSVFTTLQEKQSHHRLSVIRDVVVHRVHTKRNERPIERVCMVLDVDVDKLFDEYASLSIYGVYPPPVHTDFIFRSFEGGMVDDDIVQRKFVVCVYEKCISEDILSGMISTESIIQSLNLDIASITSHLYLRPILPHPEEDIHPLSPDDIHNETRIKDK